MVKDIQADIFTVPTDALIHQANCFHTMGSGIARFIREKFPEAYAADCATARGDKSKLGTFSFTKVISPGYPKIKFIINLYSQFDFSAYERHTRYDAMVDGLTAIRNSVRSKAKGKKVTLTLPFRIGSNRGGGDWRVVRAIIESVFGDEDDFEVLVCENPALTDILQNTNSK